MARMYGIYYVWHVRMYECIIWCVLRTHGMCAWIYYAYMTCMDAWNILCMTCMHECRYYAWHVRMACVSGIYYVWHVMREYIMHGMACILHSCIHVMSYIIFYTSMRTYMMRNNKKNTHPTSFFRFLSSSCENVLQRPWWCRNFPQQGWQSGHSSASIVPVCNKETKTKSFTPWVHAWCRSNVKPIVWNRKRERNQWSYSKNESTFSYSSLRQWGAGKMSQHSVTPLRQWGAGNMSQHSVTPLRQWGAGKMSQHSVTPHRESCAFDVHTT